MSFTTFGYRAVHFATCNTAMWRCSREFASGFPMPCWDAFLALMCAIRILLVHACQLDQLPYGRPRRRNLLSCRKRRESHRRKKRDTSRYALRLESVEGVAAASSLPWRVIRIASTAHQAELARRSSPRFFSRCTTLRDLTAFVKFLMPMSVHH